MAKILLVEDDKSLREIYGVRLSAEGYEIVSAGDGEEALAMAIKERPDLIVSDVMMPKISGFDMLDILRSTTETKDVKVIMMTALSSEDQRARGESLGADRYLVKSQVGIEDVVRTVHDVLGDGMPSTAPAPITSPEPTLPTPTVTAPTFTEPAPVAVNVVPEQVAPAPVEVPVPQAPLTPPAPTSVPISYEQPVAAPAQPPVAAPTPVYTPVPEPVAVQAPVYQTAPVAPAPQPQPAPVAAPAPSPYVAPAPVAAPAPTQMPQPTAPFSAPTPSAGSGERVIAPLTDYSAQNAGVPDLSSQIEQALSGSGVPPTPGSTPTSSL
jgi:CheY-like chemotaxis protein